MSAVYLVTTSKFVNGSVEAVFSTRELAEEYVSAELDWVRRLRRALGPRVVLLNPPAIQTYPLDPPLER